MKRTNIQKITSSDINFIKSEYPIKGAAYCASKLNRSKQSIIHIAHRHKVLYNGWSNTDISIIKQYPTISIKHCALLLGKSKQKIYRKLKELNISTKTSAYTKEQIEFLIKNYSTTGIKNCALKLNIPIEKLRTKVKKLKLTLDKSVKEDIYKTTPRHIKKHEDYNINPDQFLDITTPEAAYILGFIWADGYVYKKNYIHLINIECKADDLDLLLPTFNKMGKWTEYRRNRPNRKPQLTLSTSNKILVNFLIDNDYTSKSILSADKILSHIPKHLTYYWFRGLIDGDGCFYVNENLNITQFAVAGSFGQDWTYLENLCNQLNIKYKIIRRKQIRNGKLNGGSMVRITNRNGICKIGNYIYTNYKNDNIGLERKYKKFKKILMMSF